MGCESRRSKSGGSELVEADLSNAKLGVADLKNANLKGASLLKVNLEGVTDLTIEQLSKVKILFGVKNLDPELRKQIDEKYPHLLENPRKRLEKD